MSSKAQSEPYDRLIQRLDLAICGDYPTWTTHADALLRTIDQAAETDTRRMLWERLITRFSLLALPPSRDRGEQPAGAELSDEIRDAILERGAEQVRSFVKRLLTENRSPASTAARLMRFMDKLANADERCVALAIVLCSPLVPYAQIPSDLFADASADDKRGPVSEDVLQVMAQISRVIHDPNRRRSDDFAALAHLARKARNDQDAQKIIAYAFWCWRRQFQSRAEGGPSGIAIAIPLQELGEVLEHVQKELARRGAGTCNDPNCPRHGTGRKPKTDKPS